MNIAIHHGTIKGRTTYDLTRLEAAISVGQDELLRDIALATAEALCVPAQRMFEAGRRQPACFCRQVAMSMCRQFSAATMHHIAAFFGRYDHGTVVYAIKVVSDIESVSPGIHEKLSQLRISLAQRLSPSYIAARPAVNQYAKEENTQENESRVRRNES